jgi:hypothetical protein
MTEKQKSWVVVPCSLMVRSLSWMEKQEVTS